MTVIEAIPRHSTAIVFRLGHYHSHLAFPVFCFLFFLMFFFNLFLRQRETEHEQGGAEREADTESEAGSRLWAVSTEPDAGLELMGCEIMT